MYICTYLQSVLRVGPATPTRCVVASPLVEYLQQKTDLRKWDGEMGHDGQWIDDVSGYSDYKLSILSLAADTVSIFSHSY